MAQVVGYSHMSAGSLPAFKAINLSLKILSAGNGRYAIVRSNTRPSSLSVSSSRLSILCPSTVPCQRSKVDLSSSLPSKTYLPGSSRLWDEFEMVIATSSRPIIGLMSTGLCMTMFSARIAATCSGAGAPASRSLRNGCMVLVLSVGASGVQRRNRQGDGARHAPAFRRADPIQDHEGRSRPGPLACIRPGNFDRDIGLGDVAG